MDQSLRELFDRALGDEPPQPPGDLAREAMAGGRRRRRRRHLLAGGVAGVVTVLATVFAVSAATAPPATPTAMSLISRAGCGEPALAGVELTVSLTNDITDSQRAALDAALRSDPLVDDVRYESREAAYEKFKQMYRDAPDLIAAVTPGSIPDSFRVTVVERSSRLTLQEELRRHPGVETVVPTICDRRAKEGE